jgi:tetratricopeptide (TPR) repeat protein
VSGVGEGSHVTNTSSVTGNSVQAGTIHGDVHFHQATASTSVVPRQLPGASGNFTNRAVEKDALTTLLNSASSEGVVLLSTIDGTAGVGKSSLAVHWAHQMRDHFPDGELYVNLRGFDPAAELMSPAEALATFLVALDVDADRIPESVDARAALFRSLVHDKRLLILLDNARSAEQVRPLLPGSPTCLVIVTSRNRLDELVIREGATRVAVDVLTHEEARKLLTRYLGQDRIDAEPEATRKLVEHCARLPLALGIVAVRAAEDPDLPLDELVAELKDERERLDTLDTDGETGVRAVLSWSYHSLSAGAARMFRLLGLPTGPDISLAAAADLAGLSNREARRLLAELIRTNMLEQPTAGRYRFHDLLRAYATECAARDESAEDREAAIRRLLDHYLRTSHRIDRQLATGPVELDLPPSEVDGRTFDDDELAMSWWDIERVNLFAAVRQASARELHQHASQLPIALYYFFQSRGYFDDRIALCEIARDSARHLGNGRAEAYLLFELGAAYYLRQQYDTAVPHFQQAAPIFAALGDRYWEGLTRGALGYSYVRQEKYDDAVEPLRRGLELLREADDLSGLGHGHAGFGLLYTGLRQFDEALPHFQEALRLYRECGETMGVGSVLNNIADAYFAAERLDDAVSTYRQALAHRREIGHRLGIATSLRGLGTALRETGDPDGARESWLEAMEIFEQLDDPTADDVRTKLDALATTALRDTHTRAAEDAE